jgi:hypothetical protein
LDQILDQLQNAIVLLTRIAEALWPFLHPYLVVKALLDDSVGLLLKVWFGFILHTTDFETGGAFTNNVTIREFEPALQVAANGTLGLIVVWAAYRIMWGQDVKASYSVRMLLPRLLIGVILINFSLPLFQLVVEASNAACDAIQSFGTIPDWNTWWRNYALDQTSGIWQIITTGALIVGYDVLAIAYLIRYTILIVLAITAPLAGLLFIMPDTLHLAKQWTSIFITNLLMQPTQLFVLAIGFALERGGHTPLHHLFALAALLVVFKVPGALGGSEKVAHKLETAVKAGFRVVEHAVVHA